MPCRVGLFQGYFVLSDILNMRSRFRSCFVGMKNISGYGNMVALLLLSVLMFVSR